jgi:hypothetical protein
MTTTEEEEFTRLAGRWNEGVSSETFVSAIRSVAAERDALKTKVDSVYSERNRLAAAFARMALAAGFKAGKGVDPDETKWPVIYVETPNGQVSWHIANHDADILKGLPEYEGRWDGTWRARYADWCRWPRKARRAKARDKEFAELQIENARLREVLSECNIWLTAAIECKAWTWDGGQKEAAIFARDQARKEIGDKENVA